MWDERQQVVLADIERQFPRLDAGTRFILDGVCPYVGPAVVFESDWDLQGALRMLYRDDTLGANVVTPSLALNESGLTSTLYGYESRYPYGERLLVYHFDRKMVYPLTDLEDACQYFQTVNLGSGTACPPGEPGYGVAVLAGERPGPDALQKFAIRYSLVQRAEGIGEEFIVSPDGRRIGVVSGAMAGHVDQLRRRAGEIRLAGWASDGAHLQPADQVAVFVNGEANHDTHTVVRRPDVAAHFEAPPMGQAGFHVNLRSFSFEQGSAPAIRVFAISERGVASELNYRPEYDDGCRKRRLGR